VGWVAVELVRAVGLGSERSRVSLFKGEFGRRRTALSVDGWSENGPGQLVFCFPLCPAHYRKLVIFCLFISIILNLLIAYLIWK
jgi:hypothetical protein